MASIGGQLHNGQAFDIAIPMALALSWHDSAQD